MTAENLISLPSPNIEHGTRALESALQARRSVRAFAPHGLSSSELGQLLQAAQGITPAIEAGHAAQNLCLQCLSLGLAACEVGAFDDVAVARLLCLPDGQQPLTMVVVGKPAL